jgi:5-formyltetrahydrofolate cyclo-ligase
VSDADDQALFDHAKRQLRQRMRALRGALPAAAHRARSKKIVERLLTLDELGRAERVATFWPMPKKGEIDLIDLDTWLRAQKKHVYYPFLDKTETGLRTGFRRVDDVSQLEERGRGFLEPGPELPEAAAKELDLIVVPALAVDASGNRLGYGIGFYDVTLPEQSPPAITVVVAFSFQLCAELPRGAHDFACDLVVTDESFIRVPQ